ncbi:hypothetical protein ABFS82_13G067900 [Erythranthe guttata]|uniref:uncharacterized protein LOC105968501 n=1 Tax=Erythranthe guttata TaxID=4155 RepID=UPI00064E074B|nr:PREDICTED: uncharacterized protein LOC105968501 [Erythranthe guttata]|eukprot:XP_012848591.1 PREDICTED: uncharacterized protein LOC105968501 [Erythranthe guttata]
MGIDLKNLPWAGNVYNQLESLVQDVDEFMSQDPVKLVENQMQNVGTNFKRIYSNVLQDLFRFEDIGDIGSPKSQSVDPTCIDEEQPSVNQDSVDNTENSDAPLPIECTPLHADSSQESETCQQHLREHEHSETVIMNEIFTETSSQCDENSKLAIEKEQGKEQGVFNERKGDDGPSIEGEWVPNNIPSCRLSLSEIQLRLLLAYSSFDPYYDEYIDLYAPQAEEEGYSLEMDLPIDLADGTLCRKFSMKDTFDSSSSIQLPEIVNCDDDDEEMGFTKSTYSTSTKCSYTLAIERPENISRFPAEPDDFAYERKIEDMLPSFLLSELYGGSSFPTDRPDSPLGSFETRHEQSYEHDQSETAVIPSETGTSSEFGVGIDDDNMETVNLSPKVKHNATSVGSNVDLAHSAPRRRKDFKYFKNVIQGAFTSQKRLTKEYEHLAVLHGEIDLESSQNFEASSITIHSVKSESDWELL